MHDGCTNTSIPRSNTISLSSSIRLIAEHNHVVTTQFREGVVELVSVGVREASTFPGFCDEHEALFSDFETKKQMTTAEHFGLQAFHTVLADRCFHIRCGRVARFCRGRASQLSEREF